MTAPPMPAPLPSPVARAAHALGRLAAPWAVAGGWAIDLALGRVTRPHADVDVAMFRDDQAALRRALSGWTLEQVADGVLAPWPAGAWLAPPIHEIHARLSPAGAAADGGATLEILLNERAGDCWVYRRDPGVTRPLARALVTAPGGLRVLAPEIVLLYKSKAPRPADENDFRVGRALLDDDARAWLRAALARAAPDHPWAAALVSPEA